MNNQKYIRVKALVVGIDQYEQANQLDNAVNDAKAIADILRQLKFYVCDSYNERQIQCKEWGLNKLLDRMCHYIGHNAATKQKIQDCLYDMGGNLLI